MGELRLRVTGRNLDVGDALRTRIIEDLNAGVSRYIVRDGDGVVTVSKERHQYIVEILIHLDSGIALEATGEGYDAHPAFDAALAKIEKRVRRYKRKLKAHHGTNNGHNRAQPDFEANYSVFAAFPTEESEELDSTTSGEADSGDAPVVIAETSRAVRTMAVATAVLQLEVSEQPAIMFRNPSTGTLNMVYRRADGNIGWLDPRVSDAA